MKKPILMSLCIFIAHATVIVHQDTKLSYNDVLLKPKRSAGSRQTVSTKTTLSYNRLTDSAIELNIPIVSANMDTVTESPMAIAMAQLGGIGIVHRNNSIEEQAEEIRRVKRARNVVIENPITISPNAPISKVRESMAKHQITSLLITDEHNKLVGIITSRDMRFISDDFHPVTGQEIQVCELMTTQEDLIVAHESIRIEEAQKILQHNHIEKLPLIHDDGTLAGLITSKDIAKKKEYPHAALDAKGRFLVGGAIGVKDDAIARAQSLVAAGCDVLVIDIAHGHSDAAIGLIKQLKILMPEVHVIAGNVATPEGTLDLIDAGADAIKVGIGPGSICTTRIMTGAGYPQLSAVIECAQVANAQGIPVIADGGITYPGDITKAIAGGASTVMLGSLLAGTDESPSERVSKNGLFYKRIRGMASFSAQADRGADKSRIVPEGVEAMVPYRGSVHAIIFQYVGGLRSGMSYCGCTSLHELIGTGEFIQITQAGVKESHPHDVVMN